MSLLIFTRTGEQFQADEIHHTVRYALEHKASDVRPLTDFASPIQNVTAEGHGRYIHIKKAPFGLIRVLLPTDIVSTREVGND